MFGHQRIRKPRGTRKRTRGYEETFWNEAAAKAGERRLNQVLPRTLLRFLPLLPGFPFLWMRVGGWFDHAFIGSTARILSLLHRLTTRSRIIFNISHSNDFAWDHIGGRVGRNGTAQCAGGRIPPPPTPRPNTFGQINRPIRRQNPKRVVSGSERPR
jgi:hypothetical protein